MVAGKVPDGSVEMREVQVAYIGSGSSGGGTPIIVAGATPSRFPGSASAASALRRSTPDGEVYNLPTWLAFGGTYGQARYGFALGNASGGDLWMQNEQGVIMHLKAKRSGLMLSLGGDAMLISMAQ